MADKCPYCYRDLGTHTHDPVLLPNGSKYKWSDETHLIYVPNVEDRLYKGVYQISEPEITEIQNNLKQLEAQFLITNPTTFSPLNTSGKFQITGKHIKEMRDSVEKLLNKYGLTKTDYFNHDKDANHIIHPNGDKVEWTDPITLATDLQKFQVKYIHIEDLRHYLQLFWIETWTRNSDWHHSDTAHGKGYEYEYHETGEHLHAGYGDNGWSYGYHASSANTYESGGVESEAEAAGSLNLSGGTSGNLIVSGSGRIIVPLLWTAYTSITDLEVNPYLGVRPGLKMSWTGGFSGNIIANGICRFTISLWFGYYRYLVYAYYGTNSDKGSWKEITNYGAPINIWEDCKAAYWWSDYVSWGILPTIYRVEIQFYLHQSYTSAGDYSGTLNASIDNLKFYV